MRTLSQFVTEDSKQLSTQLSNFEQNVTKETASIRATFQLAQVPIDDDFASPRKTFTVGQCARLDTRNGQTMFYLAAPMSKLPGEFIAVQAHGSAGFVATGIGVLINGSVSYTVSTAIVTRFYFDGTGYWT